MELVLAQPPFKQRKGATMGEPREVPTSWFRGDFGSSHSAAGTAILIIALLLRIQPHGILSESVSVAVIVAVGANDDGRREALGMTVGASKVETFWTEFLRSLARRGVRGAIPQETYRRPAIVRWAPAFAARTISVIPSRAGPASVA
jgi:hypothetical protein